MNKKLLALYGLKWNPFSPQLPTEALYRTAKIDNFCWRIEQALVREGGFALISGDPGAGKSVVLRLFAERLARMRDGPRPSQCQPRRFLPRNGRSVCRRAPPP